MKFQLVNTLGQIVRSDHVNPLIGIFRHLKWQFWRIFQRFPHEIPLSQSRLFFPVNSSVAALVNCMGMYDFNNMSLIKTVLSAEKSVFFDVGANIGSYTIIASEVEESLVVSIEPHPVTFSYLEKNIKMNHRKNVLSLNLAISHQDEFVFFSDKESSDLNSIVEHQEDCKNVIKVPARRIDSLCKEYKIQPSYIKIDVEGYERSVIEGIGLMLEQVSFVIVERGENNKVSGLLHSRGFVGPYYYHSKNKLFSIKKQSRTEDPVFINKVWFDSAKRLGFYFSQ